MSRFRISDLVRFQRGVSWSAHQEHAEPGAARSPVLTIPNIQAHLDTRNLVYLSGLTDGVRAKTSASRGWILLVGSNGNPERIGNAVLIEDDTDYLFASFLVGLKPNERLVFDRYLLRVLASDEIRSHLRVTIRGSTGLQNINLPALANFEVELPPLAKQRRIAEILDTLDDQISATERIIAKVERAKQGLLEAVLTRDHTSSKLRDGLSGPPANGIYKPASLIGRGSLLVGQTAFTKDRLVSPSLARRAVVGRGEFDRFGLRDDDILISRVFATLEGVGQPAIVVDLQEPAVFESNMMRLRCDPVIADAFFIFQFLQTSLARAYITQRANLSNQASISQGVLTELPIWLPDLREQRRISAMLRAVDQERVDEQWVLGKLRAAKRGLMSDLLTGRVRVPSEVGS